MMGYKGHEGLQGAHAAPKDTAIQNKPILHAWGACTPIVKSVWTTHLKEAQMLQSK